MSVLRSSRDISCRMMRSKVSKCLVTEGTKALKDSWEWNKLHQRILGNIGAIAKGAVTPAEMDTCCAGQMAGDVEEVLSANSQLKNLMWET